MAAEQGSAPSHEIPSAGGPLAFVDDLDRPQLSEVDHHHLARVRRVRDGDELILGDGAGRWRTARMAGPSPEVTGDAVRVTRAAPPVGVAFALVKAAKPELAVQKLTELGVDLICPFEAARSVVRWDRGKADAAHARLVKVAREAAMQSRQAWLPVVETISGFGSVAARPGAVMAERGGQPPSLERPLILIGPEGGWDETERAADLPRVGLSTGVLRAETAAIAAGTLLVALRAGVVQEGQAR